MMHHYSPQLIKKCQRIFSKRSGVPISQEQAEMYLEQLAKVGNIALQLVKIYKQKNKL